MKTFSLRQPEVDAASPDEPDFPLPVADPSIRPMHRECVLGGCLYRSRFLFNAGWVLAVTFLLATALSVLYSVRTNDANEALLKENMLLYRDMAAQREQLAALSARASATPPAERGPDKAVSPPKAAPEPRRAVPPPKRSPQNAVPESEKWWNRP
jgi:hypothetical protein